MPTLVVNIRYEKFDVYVGRGSRWGNPYSHLSSSLAKFSVRTRDEAISKYREWIQTQPNLLAAIGQLKNKRLGCYCDPLPCHGHVLAELADAEH